MKWTAFIVIRGRQFRGPNFHLRINEKKGFLLILSIDIWPGVLVTPTEYEKLYYLDKIQSETVFH